MKYVETESIELKRSFNDSIEKEIVAFLNTNGGTIYIGIEDNGEVNGVPKEKLDEVMKKISDIITDKILPNPQEYISTYAVLLDEKRVVKIDIKKGKHLYYIKKYGRSSFGCYIRIGTTSKSMTEEQIENAFIKTINKKPNNLLEERSPRQDLTFRVFKIYLESKNVNYSSKTMNENFKFVDSDNKYNLLAFLLSDQFDYSVKIARFNGKDKSGEFVYRKEFGDCSLLKAMDDILSYVETNINTVRSFFEGKAQRRDEFLIDKDSFREAWINACLHNDYSTHLAPAVFVYNDHIEIFSYGNPLKYLTKEKFLKGISKPINPELAKIFMRLEYVEETGRGITTIVNRYDESVFDFSNNFLQVNLPYNENATVNATVNATDKPKNATVKLSLLEKDILKEISSDYLITLSKLSTKLNKNRVTISRNINSLKEKGLIKRVGSDKTGHWEILK